MLNIKIFKNTKIIKYMMVNIKLHISIDRRWVPTLYQLWYFDRTQRGWTT